ncbi:MAG TPA: uracil-DNA glycosylase [Casimicrobiaceae bacterium]|nr:uracil-DNA glycosylase [Casimicrobiaceae bacterium]
MATREDILVELGLTPTWRRRGTDRANSSSVATTPCVDATPAMANAPPDPRSSVAAREPPLPSDAATRSGDAPREARIAALTWKEFAADVDACNACGLCKTRNKSVPGVGDVHAEWLFVGEAPGADEDARGEPFVGQAGRLLDNMLAALGLARGRNVYIANVLKCRPPNNRTPEPREADACRPYLERQVDLIKPGLIVALGKSAASLLLGTDATIASLRGRVHRYRGMPLIVTYHPAYLLRNLPDKAKAWEDMLLARRTLATRGRDVEASPPP